MATIFRPLATTRIVNRPRYVEDSWIQNLNSTTLFPGVAPGIPRAPVITYRWVLTVPQDNARLGTPLVLLVSADVPFTTVAGANPSASPRQVLDWVVGSNSLLTAESAAPFSSPAWPNPTSAEFPGELRTWLQTLVYLGFDSFYGASGQVPTHETPNPTRAPRRPLDWIAGSVALLTAEVPPATLPFGVTSLDTNPIRRQRFATPFVYRPAGTPAAEPETLPFGVLWLAPNPRGPRPGAGFVTGSTAFLPVPTGLPSGTNWAWPNPARASFSVELRSWLGILSYLGFDTIYGAPGQVPTYESFNPILRRPNLALRTWTDSRTSLLPPPATPFARLDWPNPTTGRTPSVSLKTGSQALVLQLPHTPPVGQIWIVPNPLIAELLPPGFFNGSTSVLPTPPPDIPGLVLYIPTYRPRRRMTC